LERRERARHYLVRDAPIPLVDPSVKAILLIDHGSKRAEANHMLACMANLVQHLVGGEAVVEYAHMELAEPDIAKGFAAAVTRGATEVIAFPYMLSPGKHATSDIPRMVAEAAAEHPGLTYRMTSGFGVHEKLGELILDRAGLTVARTIAAADAVRCWEPEGCVGTCGDACRAKPAPGASATLSTAHVGAFAAP
jgi:sirohydrochlorin ferrochelatase